MNSTLFAVIVFLLTAACIGLLWKQRKLNEEKKQLEEKLQAFDQAQNELFVRQMDLKMLQNQINPHFLYNTLEAIRSEAEINDQEEIAAATETLANYFRYCINSHGEPVHLFEELENVKNYFAIIRFRFYDRMKLIIDIDDEEILQSYLPRMTLQPLVENAVNHGFENKLSDAVVTISAQRSEEIVYLRISDNGCGMNEEALSRLQERLSAPPEKIASGKSRHGVALPNIHYRLKLMFGEGFGLHIESVENEGTDMIVDYPLHYHPEEER